MSAVRCLRLKGSFSSFRRCVSMVDLSMVWPDVGKMTGSFIKTAVIGSQKSSGTSPSSSSSVTFLAHASSTLETNESSASISKLSRSKWRLNIEVAFRKMVGLQDLSSRTT
eukprot:TRINITY_DN2939_c0_g1_i4.p1 TRINITY_DN2939_c0_g1~~TRINITY_DN2939_c0_g1_i4.p1  ORF type:complete len:111 (-),score=16.02 TRINITY_DN2939_c0_g1_i4:57-389(-)